jgi:DNA ligase-1
MYHERLIMNLQTLYKKTASGKSQEWTVLVISGDPPLVRTVYGLVGGKMQTSEEKILSGCNTGKSNATSPAEQAELKARQMWQHQIDRGHYGLTVEESSSKRDAAPMLAKIYEDYSDRIDWLTAFVQPKFDGNRCLAEKISNREVVLKTRRGKVVTTTPHINTCLLKSMSVGDVFDGELYIHGVPLNKLRSLISKKQEMSANVGIRIYDQVSIQPFIERLADLQRKLRQDSQSVHLSETLKVSCPSEVIQYQATCLEQGFEGAMLRQGNSHYEAGKRSTSLLKVKTFLDKEFPIIGIEQGKGRFEGCAVFVFSHEGSPFRATAPGTLEEKAWAWKHRGELIGRSVTVKYQFMTSTEHSVPFLPICVRYGE